MSKLKYLLYFLVFPCILSAQTPNSWTQIANFPGTERVGSINFSTDSFGYVGLGLYQLDTFPYTPTYLADLWQYNPYNNIWTRKANFPGVARSGAVCFTIASKAYVGLGSQPGVYKDFWEYDLVTNMWTQLADFGGGYRAGGVGFSIGGKGYVGLGTSDTASGDEQDIWEYEPANDTWTQKNNFGGGGRGDAISFSIGNNAYVGFGDSTSNDVYYKSDLWQYDPISDTWTQKANFPGKAREQAFDFVIGTKGYIGTGIDSAGIALSDFWEYNSLTDQWIEKDSFGGRQAASAFSIGNAGYAGLGVFPSEQFHSDFWMYTPDSIETGVRSIDLTPVSIFPDPASDKLYINTSLTNISISITDMTGQSWPVFLSGSEIDVSALPAGVYCLRIQDSSGSVVRKFVKE